ncbi:MAG TPA: transcriptional regulator [Thermoplasmata archaeon]|nr:transcriptional regulator [Thermoplasmata archaeon]
MADLEFELKIPAERLLRTLKALQSRGIVDLETLQEKTFVRLLRQDFSFIGRQVTQRRRVKRTGDRGRPKDYEGPMFG